jgi:hypothetical protein
VTAGRLIGGGGPTQHPSPWTRPPRRNRFAAIGADELQAVQFAGQVAHRHEQHAAPDSQPEGLHALAG